MYPSYQETLSSLVQSFTKVFVSHDTFKDFLARNYNYMFHYVTECICILCLCCCTLCVALSVFFVCVRHSTFYVCVTCCDLDVTIRLSERAREKARGNNNDLPHVPFKRKEEIKSGTSGSGSFVVPYFQPATSTDCLHLALRSGLEVGKPNNIPASNRRANGHSHGGQRKRTWWTTRRTRGRTTQRKIGSWSTSCTR